MYSTLFRSISVTFEQPQNAQSPILTVPSGILTSPSNPGPTRTSVLPSLLSSSPSDVAMKEAFSGTTSNLPIPHKSTYTWSMSTESTYSDMTTVLTSFQVESG